MLKYNYNDKLQSMELTLSNFKGESESFLSELDNYHATTQNNITHIFDRLFDTIPKEVMNTSYKKCQQEYKKLITKSQKELIKDLKPIGTHENENKNKNHDLDNNNIIENDVINNIKEQNDSHVNNNNANEIEQNNQNNETNLMDFESHLNKDKDLTSTVKKVNATKSIFSNFQKPNTNDKVTSNEISNNKNQNNNNHFRIDESIIEENTVEETVNDDLSLPSLKPEQPTSRILLTYYLKNGTTRTLGLNDLNKLDLTDVADDCVQDLKKIHDLYIKN